MILNVGIGSKQGNEVNITPTLTQGIKIADYSIDDVNGELYAPQGGDTVDAYTKTQTDNLLIQKVDKEVGKGLFSGSYNDLSDVPTIPSKTSELQNDSGYLTEHQDLTDYAKKTDIPSTLPANGGNSDTVNNHTVETDVPENAVFTDTIYDDTEVKGSIEELKNDLIASNAGAHNSVYRGKYLGNALTTEQKAQISAGTFNDLYIGDYWTIDGVNYRIAAFDYWLNSGDPNCVTHHVVIVPDTCLYHAKMNDSNVTTGGYMGSAMYTANLSQAKTTIKAAFNGHVLNHRIYLVNAVTNGRSSGGIWADSEVDLMNEQMVYGGAILSPTSDGSNVPVNYRVEKSQLPLFALEPSRISNRDNYWLRDVLSSEGFANVRYAGFADYNPSNESFGVRPAFGITG